MKRCFECDLYTKNVTPVPIRDGLSVRIVGMPSDTTEDEAEKICRVIMALATKASNPLG